MTSRTEHVTGLCRRTNRGFTLIELLTVIAIIALLIGLLIPSLSRARDSAKNVKGRAALKSMGDSVELFKGENDDELKGDSYPASYATDDPTEEGENYTTPDIYGAQWLVRYLMGKDFKGFVPRKNAPKAAEHGTAGWLQKWWYADGSESGLPPGVNFPLTRTGPYLDSGAVKVKLPKELPGYNSGWTGAEYEKNHVFVDQYEFPILYYSSNGLQAAKADGHIATEGGALHPGIFHYGDNALFAGGCVGKWSDSNGACLEPWDFGSGKGPWTGVDGYPDDFKKANVVWRTEIIKHPQSFPYFIMDRKVFDSTDPQQVVPVRRDSYLLVSPGKDGLYGTGDDLTNF